MSEDAFTIFFVGDVFVLGLFYGTIVFKRFVQSTKRGTVIGRKVLRHFVLYATVWFSWKIDRVGLVDGLNGSSSTRCFGLRAVNLVERWQVLSCCD